MKSSNRHVLPGFSLTLGYTMLYLGLLTMVPLAACFGKAFSLSLAPGWHGRLQCCSRRWARVW